MKVIAEEQLNGHKAEMFDAIRDFFVVLTALVTVGTKALQEQLELDAKRRK